MAPYLSSHGPSSVSGAHVHFTGYSHEAHLASGLLHCPKLHFLICAAVTLPEQDPTKWQLYWWHLLTVVGIHSTWTSKGHLYQVIPIT